MITIHNNNSDITAAETQTTSKSNFVEYINSDYRYFAWAIFANIYITQFIFSCNWKSILSNTHSNTHFWICYTIIWLNKVSQSVELDVWCYFEEFNNKSRIFYQNFICY